MMNQSSTSGYWQVCPPPQTSGRRKEEKRHASATQRYDAQNLQVRIRHRTISSAAENESDELENVNEGIAGFISKLYQALQAPDDGNKYVRWTKANGKDMFVIDCIPKFTDTVLPKLFKHCKFASFVRQLNIYGFQRDTDARKYKEPKDRESCRWYHVYFRPGRKDLFHHIRRKTSVCNKRRRRTSQLVKTEALDTETIIPAGSDSEHEEYYENVQHSSSMDTICKPRPQEASKRPMVLNVAVSQIQSNMEVNLSSRESTLIQSNDDNTMYLKQQILELKQSCQALQKTFTAEIAQAYEQIQAQKKQIEMIHSVVESLRQNAGNSPSRSNNNEVASSTALQPYLDELSVDGTPKIVNTNTHTPLEQSMYEPSQQEQVRQQQSNTMTPNALVQFQKYSQVTHEPDTPPSSAPQQVSGMSSQRGGASHHHFGYGNFGQVPQSSDDWTVFSSASGDPPMAKFTALHYHHQQQAGPAQAGFSSERRPFAPHYGIMQQNNLS